MAKIVLFEENPERFITRTADDSDVREDGVFYSAKVEEGEWILYSNTLYNPNSQGRVQVIAAGEGKQPLNFIPQSLRSVKIYNLQGVTMYQHVDYGGWEVSTYESHSPVSDGTSSLIVGGAVWKLFQKINYDGSHSIRGPGKYPTPIAMGLPNDTLKSIEKM